MTDKKTVAGAYAKIDSHEDLCAERYRHIAESIADLKDGMKWAIRLSIVTLLGVALKVVIGG